MKITRFIPLLAALWMRCPQAATASKQAPVLYSNLGAYTRKVSAASPMAQRYVTQGMCFLYAFNHDEAIRAFQEAARLSPDCAMAWWGVAVANGPHINNPTVSPERGAMALDALAKARNIAVMEPVEKALLEAQEKRYASPQPADRSPLDRAYADAMRQVWKDFPQDPDVGALFAESLMDLRPWDLWTSDGKPQPGADEVLSTLEAVLKLAPSHPLANHLYIHALEASPYPQKADAAADRLLNLQPGLGHNVHMPSHIYVLRGRWKDAILSNEKAILADDAYYKTQARQGFYRIYMAHNRHMLGYAAMMCGQSERAIRSLDELAARFPKDWLKENAFFADGFLAMPFEARLRFGRWDAILAAPNPPEYCPLSRALRLYARGVAYAAKGERRKALAEQALFQAARKSVAPGQPFGNNSAADILELASHVMAGEILFLSGKREQGLAELREAAKREDALHYDEPPPWIQPARHALGAALVTAGKNAEAEKVYRADLLKHPENGWALFGLARSLERQGKRQEAASARKRFQQTWKGADFPLSTSCMCLPGI